MLDTWEVLMEYNLNLPLCERLLFLHFLGREPGPNCYLILNT